MKYKPKFNIQENSFGHRLAKLRKNRGFTQEELGKKIGISQRMVAYYESQSQHPPAALLPSLAKVLKVSLDEMLGIKAVQKNEKQKNIRLWKKLKHIDSLPKKDQKAIIHFLDALIAKHHSTT